VPSTRAQPNTWTRKKSEASAGMIKRTRAVIQAEGGMPPAASPAAAAAVAVGRPGRATAIVQRTERRPCGRNARTRTMIKKEKTIA